MSLINDVNLKCSELWWRSSKNLNLNMKKYTNIDKKNKENKLGKYIDLVIEKLRNFPGDEKLRVTWKKDFNEIIDKFIESEEDTFKLGIINKKLKEDFFTSTKMFIKEAKSFDSSLTYNDIGQAMRNVWIINILQAAFGIKVELSKGIFGYSMLYPYTDNYLDNINIDTKEKEIFNVNLGNRLRGEAIYSNSIHESRVYSLVNSIEEIYSREKYKELYESLLMIHEGQIKSLQQQEGISIPYESDILGISIEKGGASVLVDGFLTKGKLSEEELEFCIFYGFLLQVADDLQDVKDDIKNNHTTIMSQLAKKYKLDVLANKLMNFTIESVDKSSCFKGENTEELKLLIKTNCIMLILFSVVLSKEFFTNQYINIIEEYIPFSIKYIENIKSKLIKKVRKIEFEEAVNYILDIK